MDAAPDATRPPIAAYTAGGLDEPGGCFDARLSRPYILGAIVGSALGDAVGLQAEGYDTATVAERLPNGIVYPGAAQAAYRGFPPNAWTDVTEQMILTMRTLAAYFTAATEDPERDLAHRLAAWYKTGASTVDSRPQAAPGAGAGPSQRRRSPRRPAQYAHDGPRPPRRTPTDTTTRAIAEEDFLQAPRDAARAITGPKADNAALYRALACAFTTAPDAWAQTLTETTHADSRCSASAVMLALLVGRLAQEAARGALGRGRGLAGLAERPVAAGRSLLSPAARQADYVRRLTDTRALARLDLGSRDDQAYTLKTLACAMWAFRQLIRTPPGSRGTELFRRTITAVAAQGGSACANCAVAGSVLGAAMGLEALPADWREALPCVTELVAEVDDFIAAAAPTWASDLA